MQCTSKFLSITNSRFWSELTTVGSSALKFDRILQESRRDLDDRNSTRFVSSFEIFCNRCLPMMKRRPKAYKRENRERSQARIVNVMWRYVLNIFETPALNYNALHVFQKLRHLGDFQHTFIRVLNVTWKIWFSWIQYVVLKGIICSEKLFATGWNNMKFSYRIIGVGEVDQALKKTIKTENARKHQEHLDRIPMTTATRDGHTSVTSKMLDRKLHSTRIANIVLNRTVRISHDVHTEWILYRILKFFLYTCVFPNGNP